MVEMDEVLAMQQYDTNDHIIVVDWDDYHY
jgi:hypothetical protein